MSAHYPLRRPSTSLWLCVSLACSFACSDELVVADSVDASESGSSDDEEATSTETNGESTETSEDTTTEGSSDGDSTSSSSEEDDTSTSGTDGPDPVCGNGVVEGDEACDDGDDDEDNGCTSACQPPQCGDGWVQASLGEACDDGNLEPVDGCSPGCHLPGDVVGELLVPYLFPEGAGGRIDDIEISEDGQILVAGIESGEAWVASYGLGNDGELALSWQDAWALDTDSNTRATAVGVDADGFVTASVAGNVDYVVHYDPDGVRQWTEMSPFVPLDLTVSSIGRIGVAGGWQVGASRGYFPNGDLLWNISNTGTSEIVSLGIDAQDQLVAFGDEDEILTLNAFGMVQNTSQLDLDAAGLMALSAGGYIVVIHWGDPLIVAAYDTNAQELWSQPVAGEPLSEFRSLAWDGYGGVLLGGYWAWDAGGWLVRLDGETGELDWETIIDGVEPGATERIYAVAGYPGGRGVLGGRREVGNWGGHAWIRVFAL